MANTTYYSPFFPAADERGAKGTTIAAVPSAVVDKIQESVDKIQEGIEDGTIGNDSVPPAIPTNLTLSSALTDTGATILATWTAPVDDDLAGYDISFKEDTGSYIDFVTTSTRYELKSIRRNTSITAKVRAFDKAGNRSGYTNEVTLVTAKDTVPPAKPTNLQAEVAFNTINLVWTSPADADLQFVKIRIYNNQAQLIGMRDINVVPGAQGNTVFTGLQKGSIYSFTAEAVDTSGNSSGQTAAFSATTAGGINLNDLTPGLQPIKTVPSLPNPSGYNGPSIVFSQADGKLYRYVNGAWKSTSDDIDTTEFVTNTNLVNYKIADSNLSTGIIKSDNLVPGAVTLDKIGSDVTIGSTNLVRNSNALGPRWAFGPGNIYTLPTGFAPYNNDGDNEITAWEVINKGGFTGGNAIAVRFSNNNSTKGVYLTDVSGTNNAYIMKANRIYTVSFYARASGGALGKGFNITYNTHPSKNIPVSNPPLTGQYQRYVFRQEWGAATDSAMYVTIAGGISNTASIIDFSDFQIEEGSIVSAYSPALVPGEIAGAYLAYKAVARDNIDDNAVTAEKILAGSIVADKIATGAIIAEKIGAGAIVADKIQSGTIRATHLAIGSFDQLNPDPTFRDTTYWYNNGVYNGALSTGSDYRGWYNIHGADIDSVMGYRNYIMLWSDAFPMAANARQHLFSNTADNIKPNTVYELSAQIRNSTNQIIYVYLRQIRADGSHIGDIAVEAPAGSAPNVYRKQFTSHPECRKYHFIIFNQANNLLNGNAQVSDVQVVKASMGTTIADGVITTDKIAANAITAGKIAANSIAANILTVSTRPFSFYNLRFGVGNDGNLSWQAGYVQYVNSNGDYVSEFVGAGSISPQFPMHYLFYYPGSGGIGYTGTEQIQKDPNAFMVGQWNGTKSGLTVKAGVGTLINGDQIITGSLNADRIIARSISADKIAAGSLTANEIAANTISANKLVLASRPISTAGLNMRIDTDGVLRWDAGSVIVVNDQGTTNEYTVSAGNAGGGWPIMVVFVPGRGYFDVVSDRNAFLPNAGHIKIADRNGLWDLKPYAGVGMILSGDRIVTGSIQATKIVANSITANQIAVGTITANNIAAGTITAAQIATGAITATKLAIGNPDNVIPDDDFRDAAFWGNDARVVPVDLGFTVFDRGLDIQPLGGIDVSTNYFAVEPGATYKVLIGVDLSSNFNGFFTPVIHLPGVRWQGMRRANTSVGPGTNAGVDSFTQAGYSDNTSVIVENPFHPGCRNWQIRFTGSWTGRVLFSVKIVRVSDTTLIQDGAISTSKIVVNSLNGDRILAGTLDANKITANTISANQLTLGLQSRVVNNLLNTSFWGTGTGAFSSVPYWSENNSGANYWAHVISPGGGSEIALRMIANGTEANGGWNVGVPVSEGFSPDKAYRYYTWYLADNDGKNNSIYHGTDNVQHMAGGNADNPYFFSFSKSQLQRGKWYLLVGYVHPRNTGAANSGISGVYDPVTGARVLAGSDYRWRPDATSAQFRSYQYYGAIGGIAWFTKPVVEEVVQGQTPSIRSLMNELDFGSVVNTGSTLIRPGLIQITGGTTIENWKNGGDSTEIRGGAIAANTITANKLTIGNRGLGFLGLNFEWNPSNNYVSWSEGYITYVNDSGNTVSQHIVAGNSGGALAHRVFYWVMGENYIRMTHSLEAAVGDNKVLIASWWGGANLNVNYGGTIIHGDRITTGTINANRIVAGSILTDSIQIGNTGITLGQAPTMATWSNVSGTGKPADNATVGAPAGTYVGNKLAQVVVSDLDNMLSDGVLSRNEKPELITRWNTYYQNWRFVRDAASNQGVSFSALDTAYYTASDYLISLSPGWADINNDTAVNGAHLRNLFSTLDAEMAEVRRTTSNTTATRANWNGVSGTGKPADNATVGAPAGTYVGNTEAQQVTNWAYTGNRDPATRINENVTTINGGKITTGSIEALQIAANTITANKLNITSLSAITANIGNLVSYNGSGGRVERDGNGSRIYDNSGRLRMRWGFW